MYEFVAKPKVNVCGRNDFLPTDFLKLIKSHHAFLFLICYIVEFNPNAHLIEARSNRTWQDFVSNLNNTNH